MPLSTGTRLGPYDILAPLGAGGMGEVYRARDTKLNRDVALKVLPDAFTLDADRLSRFKREAQVLASLNHPNIGAIYGLEDSSGVQALVLELVEGPTVADRISQGPMPLDEALPTARQVAEALEAAHAQGIIHRDLKPANIKLRPDGTVKVLDFGLAKALDLAGAGADVTASPTITTPAMTRMGVILGTAAYMSPEQARGKALDNRSDIWAFGGVLYEMLTGKRAFDGDDVAQSLASVLKSDPDWNALPASTPHAIRHVLRRCLEKDPRRRYHDVADVRLDLDERLVIEPAVSVRSKSNVRAFERSAWALVVILLAAFAAFLLVKPQAPPPVVQFQIDPPANMFFGTLGGGLAGASGGGIVSPDGTRLVFLATDQSGRTFLWLRSLDSVAARALPGTEGASFPFWSPDSRFVGFSIAGKLKKMDAAGGPPQTLCEVPGIPRGFAWARDVILFSSGIPPTLYRVSSEGGKPAPVWNANLRQGALPAWPHFLPDGRHFIYRATADGVGAIYLASIDDGLVPRRLLPSDTNALYAPSGFLLFVREGTLLRQRFDLATLEVTGDATPVAEHVINNLEFGGGAFSVSGTGVLAFQSGSNISTQFAWLDRGGRLIERVGPPGNYRQVALSPDERRLAYVNASDRDIWILDLSRQTRARLTVEGGAASPVWSPDGSKVMYRVTYEGGKVLEKSASGVGTEQVLFNGIVNGPSQISSDGKFLLYFALPPGQSGQDIYVMPLTGERNATPVVHTQFPEVEPRLSPDMRWLAYVSSDTGRNEVYVQPFPPTGAKWQISNNGGRQPIWREDGKELFFVSDDRKFYAVDIRAGQTFDYSVPHFLFDMHANVFNSANSYAPSRDGQRFIVNTLLDNATSRITVVLNSPALTK